jgi:uncharacterized lipoprotein YajG
LGLQVGKKKVMTKACFQKNALKLMVTSLGGVALLTGCGTVLDCLTQTPSSITTLVMAQEKI